MSNRARDQLLLQEANALSLAAFFRAQINKLDKTPKKPDPKITNVLAVVERNRLKKYT